MADNSAIEWTDATWNPIRARNKKTGKVGWHCEHATTGCELCYAEKRNKWIGTGLPFKPGHRNDIEIFLDEEMLTQPLRWKKPRLIFPGSMTDLFADFVTDAMLDKIFAVMALCPQHTFQVLTKRAKRMRDYFGAILAEEKAAGFANEALQIAPRRFDSIACELTHSPCAAGIIEDTNWPLPNVWLGVSAERQQEADERIPLLLQTPAAVRFISAEPLLGPIRLDRICEDVDTFKDCGGHPDPHWPLDSEDATWLNALLGRMEAEARSPAGARLGDIDVGLSHEGGKLDQVIAGGESGPKARPMHPDWARSLRDQCAEAGVAFFFKQWGEWAPSSPEQAEGNPRSGWQTIKAHPHVARAEELYPQAGAAFVERVGKKAAGRLLDGVEHNGFPTTGAGNGI